jgi:hypothetical protein
MSEKGVLAMDRLVVVSILHRTLTNSFTHTPLCATLSIVRHNPWSMNQLALSTSMFLLGYAMEAKCMFVPMES